MEEIRILEGAEEFSLGEGPVGALLVHGFTGSPQGMRDLAEYLSSRGIATAAPRLPGHGTTWQDLGTRRAGEWTDTVETAFFRLTAEKQDVFLIGLSFGAALCLDLAAKYPERVSGIVTLAGMVASRDPRRFLAPVIRRLVKTLPGVSNDIADTTMREIAYDRLPTSAAHEVLRFVKRARLGLTSIRCPILVVHSRNDHTVHPSNATLIYESVSSEDKELVWLAHSYHVITLDLDKQEVFERTYEFVRRRARTGLTVQSGE